MTKTFFQRTYHLNVVLSVIALLYFFLGFSLHLLIVIIDTHDLSANMELFVLINDKLMFLSRVSHQTGTIIGLILVSLLIIEIGQRFLRDSIWNYGKSIYQTIRLKQFLRQEEISKPCLTIENQTASRYNPIHSQFNKAVDKCIVDVRKESITVFLKIPSSQQAQKLLKEMEEDIKEEVSNRNPDYYFSSLNREGHKLWFTGIKR
ncbi:hypothetical protein [Streptococcus halichoeri]|uniref:hypothetical protein n=1 Tax=Streptococcus halichoeri TaxID=254785 RepID=UPI00135B94F1|nr:hypothetical protein [Streptococcus halichoeri]